MAIPIQNLYYLLAYAWGAQRPAGVAAVAGLSAETPMDLVAELLAIAAERLVKRGLDRGYLELSEDLQSPRGKMDLSTTAKRGLLVSRRVHCEFAELRHNVPHNQVVKGALIALARSESVDQKLRKRLRKTAERMAGVDAMTLSGQLIRRVQLHRNNAQYRFPIRLAELAFRHLIVQPQLGAIIFPDYTANEQEMGLLFERFVRNFLAREQQAFRVSAAQITWDARALSLGAERLLPTMRSDVTLSRPGERIILETKCYGQPLGQYYGKRALHSAHLYQLLAYLRSLSAFWPHSKLCGLLLYAGTESKLEFDYEIHGIPVMVRSLDLSQPWYGIRSNLLEMVTTKFEEAA